MVVGDDQGTVTATSAGDASARRHGFHALSSRVGRFRLRDKIFLIPEMNRTSTRLFAATFQSFGIQARVLETGKGLDLGAAYTSGKECYPCQITLGDILHFLRSEKMRLGERFDAGHYVYFMPESDGPCRFGMYNKYQRIVLDSFPEFRRVKIGALSAEDAYSLEGLIEEERIRDLRKAAYLSVITADVLDRLTWRIRPYERLPGVTDRFMERSLDEMSETFERSVARADFDRVVSKLENILQEGRGLIDPEAEPKPLIGIVGEIYVRTHETANKNLVRMLEKYGAEVVNASIAEWMNYISFDGLRDAKTDLRWHLKLGRFRQLKPLIERLLSFGADLLYKEFKQRQVYRRACNILELAEDEKITCLEKVLRRRGLFTFDISTESCLSLATILKHAEKGYNGIVNVYPFTCMPSTVTSAVIRPLVERLHLPYLDMPYEAGSHPGDEAAIRTFMYQAQQHLRRHGRKIWGEGNSGRA